MKILIAGYYGFGNVGDEAVLQAILQGMRGRDRNLEIIVLSAKPQLTQELYGVNSIYRYDWKNFISETIKSDILLIGGGSLFQNISSNRSLLYYVGLVLAARLLGKKVVIFAQGFGPLKGKFYYWLTRLAFKAAVLITLRDLDSFTAVQKMRLKNKKIYLTADPTPLLNVTKEKGEKILSMEGIKKSDRPTLGIALRSLLKGKALPHEKLAELIDWMVKKYNYYPVFLLFQCPEDMDAAAKVIGVMQESSTVIFRICQPEEMLSIISQLDLLIGMRLHALIFAALSGVPAIGLTYDPKVEAFMNSIQQPCFSLDRFEGEGVKASLAEIISKKEEIVRKLTASRENLRRQAEFNFDLFFDLINRR